MIEETRGNIIRFYDFQFRDINKDPTIPETVSLRVRYLKCGCEKFDDIDMTEAGGLFSAEWDSSSADAGTIYWHVRSVAPPGEGQDGQFRLKANPANPQGE